MKISVRPQFQPAIEFEGSAALRLVIPTGAKRSGGTCFFLHRQPIQTKALPYDLSSRPKRSEVEGSAVLSTPRRSCSMVIFDRSVAKWTCVAPSR